MSTPAITAFRERVGGVAAEAAAARRDVVVLAVDGIPFDLAREAWAGAEVERMTSVFPTTSSAAWLSSLTGMSVDEHGVPGVVFRPPGGDGELVNLYEHHGPLCAAEPRNVFSDAAGHGLTPLAILGDLEPYDCSWRDLLLRDATPVAGHRFYTATPAGRPPLPAAELCARVREALRSARAGAAPAFVWCFVEPDRHVHYHGYDAHVDELLAAIDGLAGELAGEGVAVVAH
nr:alkaline phosphatase family protein [Actinomycetota bacterium]